MAGVRVGNGSLTVPEATPVANNRGSRPGRRSRAGTGKAAFRKAMAQAASQGHAHYRGQVLTVRRDFVPSAGRAVRARAVQDRVRCLTWNCSGLSPELHAEFLKYLEVVGDIGFFSLQETHWGFDSEWTAATWHFIHSTTGKQRSGGILVGLSSKYVEHSTIKWRDVIPGRLVHIRFTYKRQQIDLVVLYQHALSYSDGEQRKELMKHRTAVWGALDTLLTALPLRSSIVLMGDFNVTLEPTKAAAGYGIHQGGQGSELKADRKRAMDLLCKHKLCALNTWGCKQFTYHHPNGASQIDYICIRQALSDGQSKQCGVIRRAMFLTQAWELAECWSCLLLVFDSIHIPHTLRILLMAPGWLQWLITLETSTVCRILIRSVCCSWVSCQICPDVLTELADGLACKQ